MSAVWRVHAVLGGAEALRPTDPPGSPGLRLPDGTGTTRWLSGGASAATGWPLRTENILNGAATSHIVLNLSDPGRPARSLYDELDPGFPEGLPRLGRIAEEVRSRLADLGLRSELGWLGIFLSEPPPPSAARKLGQIAWRLGFTPLMAGLDPALDIPASAPRTTDEAEGLALRVAAIFGSRPDQPKAPRRSRAKAGSSGSRAPIE